MIVISGVLLLVAVVFLVIGLFSSIVWVYASIGVSVLSFLFLLLGVRQRRTTAPATGGAAAPVEPTPSIGARTLGAGTAAGPAAADSEVTVVSPRGNDAEDSADATAALRRPPTRTAAAAPAAAAGAAGATAKKAAAAKRTTKTATRTPARKTAATTSSTAKKAPATPAKKTTTKKTAAKKTATRRSAGG